MNVTELDKAHYSIFKSLTHFSYVDYDTIEKVRGVARKALKTEDRFFSPEDFRELRTEIVQKNEKGKGIPQGSAISSVYANTYMVDFDKSLNAYATNRGGLYRRYCDDIIVVIPTRGMDFKVCDEAFNFVMQMHKDIPNIEINEDKTEQYIFADKQILLKKTLKKSEISYLGFEFDGKNVRIRDKSVFKFYCRAYRKIDQINHYFDDGKMQEYTAGKKAIYNGYTHLFSRHKAKKSGAAHGNFITYAYRADDIFSKSELLESNIKKQMRRHWSKIDSKIKKMTKVEKHHGKQENRK